MQPETQQQMSNEQKLERFMQTFHVQEDIARQYLDTNNWILENAIDNYETENSPTSLKDAAPELSTLKVLDSKNDQPKRVHMSDSTPALTTYSSEHSMRVWGRGMPLGTSAEAQPNETTESTKNVSIDTSMNVSITMIAIHLWADGFTIEDGNFRTYDEPENLAFLEAVTRHEFPPELFAYGNHIDVKFQNHTSEKYKRDTSPEFQGSGHMLNSSTPPMANVDVTQPADNFSLAGLSFDAAQPSTRIKIRLADGTRISAGFNLTHTVSDIYAFVQHACPEHDGEFMLMTTYPTKDLISSSMTIEEAGLQNVLLTLRYI